MTLNCLGIMPHLHVAMLVNTNGARGSHAADTKEWRKPKFNSWCPLRRRGKENKMALEIKLYNFITDGATPVEKKRISKFVEDLENYNNDRGYIIDPKQKFHYWNINDAVIGIICNAWFEPEELRKIKFPRGMRKEIFEGVGTYDQNIDIHTINNLKVTPKALSNYIRHFGPGHIFKEEEW